MQELEFKLNTEYIELNKLLKIISLVESGGLANNLILTESNELPEKEAIILGYKIIKIFPASKLGIDFLNILKS